MTEFLDVDGGRIAYDVTGEGPLVVLAHGMGDQRNAYRHLIPLLVQAGYRVANADLRGHGESSVEWTSYTRTDTAHDLLALIHHLGGPAVIIGHSFSGGSATIAAALDPEAVTAIVEVDPFTRVQSINVGGLLRISRYRRGLTLLLSAAMLGNLSLWMRYLHGVAFPGSRPADFDEHMAALRQKMQEPGRMAALKKMGQSAPADAGAQLANIKCPALIVSGTEDPDFADPRAEAEAIVAAMPTGLGRVTMIEGAGHYPHTQYADQVAAAVVPFLQERVGA